MGNRAVLRVSGDSKVRGIEVHWNGGRGFIAAFVQETKSRLGRDWVYREQGTDEDKEADITAFFAMFASTVRDFFGYDGRYKGRELRNTYMCAFDVSGGTPDNGCYTIDNDFTCKRIDMDNMSEYDAGAYLHAKAFFNKVDAALSTVFEIESEPFRKTPQTESELLAKHQYAKTIADNAAARLARIEAELAAHGVTLQESDAA